jgi:hypothetical protein
MPGSCPLPPTSRKATGSMITPLPHSKPNTTNPYLIPFPKDDTIVRKDSEKTTENDCPD